MAVVERFQGHDVCGAWVQHQAFANRATIHQN